MDKKIEKSYIVVSIAEYIIFKNVNNWIAFNIIDFNNIKDM